MICYISFLDLERGNRFKIRITVATMVKPKEGFYEDK